jgi:hypothetical protein
MGRPVASLAHLCLREFFGLCSSRRS